MKVPTTAKFLCLGLLAMSLISGQAYATLGEKADSIAKDRIALSAAKRSTKNLPSFTVQEMASESTTVREYLTPSGVVFAVAWNGLAHPDLTPLLGAYFPEYQSAKEQTPRKYGRRQSRVAGDRVVVETWGHMRNLQGRAYIPALVPEGVDIYDIK